jgi:hypothetical protein
MQSEMPKQCPHLRLLTFALGERMIHPDTLSYYSTKDEGCINFFSRSLERCLNHHKDCSFGQNDWMPTRMLEVFGHSRSDKVRLVERKDIRMAATSLKSKYITLSHVWGTTHPLKLTMANYEKFKDAIDIKHLPKCFSDAVHITRRLGVPYLWIDSLWYAL